MANDQTDPTTKHHDDGFPGQEQDQPATTDQMSPGPDHGEDTYVGHGRLEGRRALITSGTRGAGARATPVQKERMWYLYMCLYMCFGTSMHFNIQIPE